MEPEAYTKGSIRGRDPGGPAGVRGHGPTKKSVRNLGELRPLGIPATDDKVLQYALDLWFENRIKRKCNGEALIIRYADDFVCAFQYEQDAELFYQQLYERLGKFALEVSPDKTHPV